MPGRPLLLDLGSRSGPVCRSCLYSIRRQAAALARPPAAAAAAAHSPGYSSGYSSRARPTTRPGPSPPSRDSLGRPPSAEELRRYRQGIQELRGPTRGADAGADGGADADADAFSVRFFEQDGSSRRELEDEEAFGGSLGRIGGSELREALSGISGALTTAEERHALGTVMREMGGDMDAVASADDLESMTARMQAYTDSLNAEIEQAGAGLPREILDQLRQDLPDLSLLGDDDDDAAAAAAAAAIGGRSLPPQIPKKPWTTNQRKKVVRLNSALARAHGDLSRRGGLAKTTVSSVYKAYHAARLPLSHGWSKVPADVWDLLWAVLSADESINTHRLARVSLLARDMSEARVTLSPPQQLLTIEAVFVDGWESKALESWRRCAGTLGDDGSDVFQPFWELGVRMHCRLGDVDQAERAAARLLAKRLDARILMPIIRTLSDQGTAEGQARAWAKYREMRQLLGKGMALADYDHVVSCFLASNQTENALYAFVDMMSDGEMDLRAQRRMPSVVANKFFLGKWLKRLIGAGDLAGALSVVEFMRARGVDAAPIHLNGLVGAWQRSGGADDLERADRLAWAMVESRIAFVRARRRRRRRRADVGRGEAAAAARPWPRATLETFSLLAQSYRLRGLHARLAALWDAFREAEISPDAFMMNQLLESHIQAGQAAEALALYRSLVHDGGVAPDPYTFSALWKTPAVNRLHVVAPKALPHETAATRRLFAETARARPAFAAAGAAGGAVMDGQLARKILHTFRRLGDAPGLVVALSALARLFAFLPPETLALELLLGTTRLAWDTAPQRRRLVLAKRDLDRALLAASPAADAADAARGEALRYHLQKRYWPADDESARTALVEAAREMGVYDLLAPGSANPVHREGGHQDKEGEGGG